MSVARRLVMYRIAQATTVVAVSALTARSGARPAPEVNRGPAQGPSLGGKIRLWTAPRPAVVPRAQWQAGQSQDHLPPAHYAPTVQAVIVHQSESGNDYRQRDVGEIIVGIYTDHVGRRGWDDIGYNFLVDKEGTLYEGRHGGIDRPVIGAHANGFNIGTVGIAAIGTYREGAAMPEPMLNAIARLAAWKLGLYGIDPRARVSLTSTSTSDDSRYRRGECVTVDAVLGHCDIDHTDCPGAGLYAMLPLIRATAARLQGRTVTSAS
ncbi:peptidoglycan recognition protein [Streptomyces sp. RB6PN25]|uniref:Peptidoglycan recognition protein n=1 Tax=Streptomyces humicola TaxID=2953240 RepID=A0ABT1PY42_9ACTN|nr:peptidoglycan recognition protein [Streptomyces humicola]MCQ4082028.1 peptidoglycan recognition protein [Streptomyces humicola]